ncbi:MAG: hypothetical protein JWQ38_3600 [Flavipsychrobacter sp.]|nr:hypothetical protein [Flavipsychrobacter sp.]
MRKYFRSVHFSFVVLLAILFGSCAPARYVRPLAKGKTVATATFGGPLIKYSGMTIPVPLLGVAAAHGYKDDLTGFAGLHATSLFFGVLQIDAGVVKGLRKPDRWIPGISVSPVANLMLDKWAGKFSFFPQADVNAYWNYGKQNHYCYIGLSNWFDLHTTRAEGEPQTKHWLPVIQAGNVYVRKKMEYTLELKYIAPNYSSRDLVVPYIAPGQNGAIGLYIGVTRKF